MRHHDQGALDAIDLGHDGDGTQHGTAIAGRAYTPPVAAVALHPDLGRLGALLGEWEGEGHGTSPAGVEFSYRERSRFDHNGKPMLVYTQRTRAIDDGRPLHTESGYWRAAPGGAVELVLAHGTGFVEVEQGRWDDEATLRLVTTFIQGTPTAKRVTALERDFTVDGRRLCYELRMATDAGAARFHLSAELRRV